MRFRPSHSGHNHPTNSAAVSSRWATSRNSSRALPAGSPDRVVTRIPNSARPMVHPISDGISHLFTIVATPATTAVAVNTHHSQPRTAVVYASSAIVAITAAPGSRSTASAPARAGQDARRIVSASVIGASVVSSSSAVTT